MLIFIQILTTHNILYSESEYKIPVLIQRTCKSCILVWLSIRSPYLKGYVGHLSV